jgi:hypothetical protein
VVEPTSINVDSLPFVAIEDRRELPVNSCVYFAIDSQNVIQYIGQTINLRRRWGSHHHRLALEEQGKIRIAYLEISDTTLLASIEEALIQHFLPPLNKFVRKPPDIEELEAISNISPIDLSPILTARSLTTYSAAKLIQEATGEQWGAVYQRLKRWGKGEPPCVAIVLRDLAVLGYGLKLVKLKKERKS